MSTQTDSSLQTAVLQEDVCNDICVFFIIIEKSPIHFCLYLFCMIHSFDKLCRERRSKNILLKYFYHTVNFLKNFKYRYVSCSRRVLFHDHRCTVMGEEETEKCCLSPLCYVASLVHRISHTWYLNL